MEEMQVEEEEEEEEEEMMQGELGSRKVKERRASGMGNGKRKRGKSWGNRVVG